MALIVVNLMRESTRQCHVLLKMERHQNGEREFYFSSHLLVSLQKTYYDNDLRLGHIGHFSASNAVNVLLQQNVFLRVIIKTKVS